MKAQLEPAASILAADFVRQGILLGVAIARALRPVAKLPLLEAHLMITAPVRRLFSLPLYSRLSFWLFGPGECVQGQRL